VFKVLTMTPNLDSRQRKTTNFTDPQFYLHDEAPSTRSWRPRISSNWSYSGDGDWKTSSSCPSLCIK